MPCASTNLLFPASPVFIPRSSCVSLNSRASAVVFRAPRQQLDTPGHHPAIPFSPHRARLRRRAASFKSLYRKRARAACPHIILLSKRASDTALGLLGIKKNSLVRLARYSGVDSSEVPSIIRDHVRGRLHPKSGALPTLFVWIAWLLIEERLDPRWVITKFGFLASGRKATR